MYFEIGFKQKEIGIFYNEIRIINKIKEFKQNEIGIFYNEIRIINKIKGFK